MEYENTQGCRITAKSVTRRGFWDCSNGTLEVAKHNFVNFLSSRSAQWAGIPHKNTDSGSETAKVRFKPMNMET